MIKILSGGKVTAVTLCRAAKLGDNYLRSLKQVTSGHVFQVSLDITVTVVVAACLLYAVEQIWIESLFTLQCTYTQSFSRG